MPEVLDDQHDAFAEGGGAPVPSWKTLGVGGHQGGVILPQIHPKSGLLVAYLTTQQTSMPEDGLPSQPLTYDNGDPRLQAEYLVATDIRDFSDCARRFKMRATENDQEDDGLRRVIVKGRTGSKSMKKNGRTTFGGQGRPEYGAYLDYALVDQVPNKSKPGEENMTECSFRKADAASRKIVHDYMAANMPEFLDGNADAFEGDSGGTPVAAGAQNAGDDPEF